MGAVPDPNQNYDERRTTEEHPHPDKGGRHHEETHRRNGCTKCLFCSRRKKAGGAEDGRTGQGFFSGLLIVRSVARSIIQNTHFVGSARRAPRNGNRAQCAPELPARRAPHGVPAERKANQPHRLHPDQGERAHAEPPRAAEGRGCGARRVPRRAIEASLCRATCGAASA